MASISLPFYIDSSGRVAKATSPEKIVEQQIIDVLTTSRFERVMRPLYGAGANQLLFEPVDDLVYSEFRTDALTELNKQLTYASVTNLRVGPARYPYIDEDPAVVLEITVQYKMSMSNIKNFSFQIAIPQDLTEESLIL
jgi:phage baseplate assembly protein W